MRFLQPGPWGCFQGLPVRKDVVQGLINQGITVFTLWWFDGQLPRDIAGKT